MEYWDIYDRKGKKQIKVKKKGQRLDAHEYHLVVEGWIQVGDREFLIQRRSLEKKMFPGMWYCSVAGSVIAGETALEGLLRETREELGIELREENIRLRRIITDENTIFYIYHIVQEVKLQEITMQEEEVMDVAVATVPEIYSMIREGRFIGLDYYDSFFREFLEDEKTEEEIDSKP